MIVATFVDPAGSMDMEPEEEQKDIIETLKSLVFDDGRTITPKYNLPPWAANKERFDIYVIDYGGMTMGARDTAMSMFRDFAQLADNYPNRLFLIWSSFSAEQLYSVVLEDELRKNEQPNVIVCTDDIWHNRVKEWFGMSDS